MKLSHLKLTVGVAILVTLGACGGGTGQTAQGGSKDQTKAEVQTSDTAGAATKAISRLAGTVQRMLMSSTTATNTPISPQDASRFLSHASFGATDQSIAAVAAAGQASWIEAQFALPQTLHRNYMVEYNATLKNGAVVSSMDFQGSFWKQAVTGEDQLRQRMAYALSQIFVISTMDSNLYHHPLGVADYYDKLGQYAFGNYRDLLQMVALHPMMGTYLSHLRNQKEGTYRVPDENFAREIMQLMSIGLYQLNQDGSQKLVNGQPVETYTHDDIAGLAKVFTGWSWAGPDQSVNRFFGVTIDPARDYTPMQIYPDYHSGSTKSFLGVTLSGNNGPNELTIALNTLFNHPNVGPFIGRELIQRLVMSNPSPAYISRVAAAFADNGSGVRGDMKAVIRAVLLDPEALDASTQKKLREPVLRLANWMRAFKGKSSSGYFPAWPTDDPSTGLGQSALRSPSVFNFYRPNYTPPNSTLATAGKVAPEMQITNGPSTVGYLNFMQDAIPLGVGKDFDVKPDYTTELGLILQPDQLVDRVNLLLLNGTMSSTLRNAIISAVNSIEQPVPTMWNAWNVDMGKKNRVYLAIYLAMASPEYLVQR
ncbi:DUF1800 family protein [Rugamonas sp. FT107W]|uniref:DUF1800 family protein n=1 Tax=Duganella vulcania TaxID=2692166 RepID=A0A845HCJ3_9BURK|nr:DUF1800 domain-containing protein [Duganella vulcania]MYN15977.1 DUF1800 family protein [Duganella vulcania]